MPNRAHVEQLMTDMTRMGKAFTAMRGLFPTPFGVDNASIPLLLKLSHEPQRVGALAQLVHSDISTVSRQVSTLVEQGFVQKSADPADRRAQVLELTPAGREAAAAVREVRCRLVAEMLAEWPDAKVIAASDAIKDFTDALEAALNDDQLSTKFSQLALL